MKVIEQKEFFWGRMGSAGRAQNKPQNLLFFNFNRKILLKITKRVHGKIFIKFDRTDCKIIAFEVKKMKLQPFGYFLTVFEDMGKIVKLV